MTPNHADLMHAANIGDEAGVQQWLSKNGARTLPDAQAIMLAARNGHEAIVRRLLPVSDPKAKESLALVLAAENGHEAIVRLLLPVSDPKADDSLALVMAALCGHEAVVAILVEFSGLTQAWNSLIQDKAWKGLDRLASYMPEDRLEAALKQAPPQAMPRARAQMRAQRLSQTLAKTLTGAVVRPLRNRL